MAGGWQHVMNDEENHHQFENSEDNLMTTKSL